MAKRRLKRASVADQVLETNEGSVLDLIDHLLNKGVTATGDVTLGVAGVDLVYVRLSALLCAADRVLSADFDQPKPPRHLRQPRRRVRP